MALLTQAPARKLAYHLDESQVSWWIDGGAKNILTQTQLNSLNDSQLLIPDYIASMNSPSIVNINILFPQKYNIDRYFIFVSHASTYPASTTLSEIKVSYDTTNGINGAWNSLSIPTPNGMFFMNDGRYYGLVKGEWFDDSYISGQLNSVGIKGITFRYTLANTSGSYYLNTLNLYGNINDTYETQRLEFTDVVGNALTQDIFYNTQRSKSDIVSLYIKNLHSTSTTKIVFSIDGEITSVNNNTTISVDGGTTWNILPYTWDTSLASNTVSSIIKFKYIVSSTETIGLKYYEIQATPVFT